MAHRDGLSEILGRTKVFGALDAALLGHIAAAMRTMRFLAGQTIFSRGDPGTAIYLVLEGRVRISVLTPEGRELSFAHALAGDVFGEIAVIDRSERSAGATALTDVEAMSLSSAETDRLLAAHPELARAFMRFLCARLREVSDHFEHVALLPIEARVARFILDRIAHAGDAPSGGRQRIELGLSQTELALLLGASRPKVNLALTALEQAGAIRRVAKEVECDTGLLEELANRH